MRKTLQKPGSSRISCLQNVRVGLKHVEDGPILTSYRSEHVDFAESTEEIAPLTEEEKKAKLEELRQRLAEKRAGQTGAEKEEQKRNEVSKLVLLVPLIADLADLSCHQAIRRKSTKETQDIKEDLQKKERMKEAAAKRKEKQDEMAAKERIRMKIKADQEERRLKAQKEKAEREGRVPPEPLAAAPVSTSSSPVASKPASAYAEARLRLQTPSGNIQKSFPVDTTLFEVAAAVEEENGMPVQSFTVNFPRKTFSQGVDFGQSLKEAGLVPSAALIVK